MLLLDTFNLLLELMGKTIKHFGINALFLVLFFIFLMYVATMFFVDAIFNRFILLLEKFRIIKAQLPSKELPEKDKGSSPNPDKGY